jgi:hypothetical protein
MQEKSDRRTLIRFYKPGAVVRYKHKKKTGIFASYSEEEKVFDLSKSGVAFPMEHPLKFGQSVILKVSFPDGKTLRLKGHVRWQNREQRGNNFITGIQFSAFGRNEDYNSPKALEYLRSLQGQSMIKRNHQNTEKN